MKIPASKVPAQVWADKMRTEGDGKEEQYGAVIEKTIA